MFTKRVRKGTVGVGVAKPVYADEIDWGAVFGVGIVVLIVLGVLGNMAG